MTEEFDVVASAPLDEALLIRGNKTDTNVGGKVTGSDVDGPGWHDKYRRR